MMKQIGALSFAAGFLAGAFFLVQRLDDVNWPAFAVSAIVCASGVAMMRRADRRDQSSQRAADANMSVILTSLEALVRKVADINERREQIGVYGIHGELDDALVDDLNAFVGAREALVHKHGLDRYAQVMDAFAAGERALNRAWSASADGYIDEVWASLERAHRAFQRASESAREP